MISNLILIIRSVLKVLPLCDHPAIFQHATLIRLTGLGEGSFLLLIILLHVQLLKAFTTFTLFTLPEVSHSTHLHLYKGLQSEPVPSIMGMEGLLFITLPGQLSGIGKTGGEVGVGVVA